MTKTYNARSCRTSWIWGAGQCDNYILGCSISMVRWMQPRLLAGWAGS